MTARSVPDRALRCQPSRRVIWSGADRPSSRIGGCSLAVDDLGRRGRRGHDAVGGLRLVALAPVEPLPDLGVLALVGGDGVDLRVGLLLLVDVDLVALERLDELRDRLRPEDPRRQDDEPDPDARPGGGGHGRAQLAETGRPDLGVAALVRGDVPERRLPPRVPFDRRQRVVEGDRILLELEVLQALRDVHDQSVPNADRWIGGILGVHGRTGGSTSGCTGSPPAADGSRGCSTHARRRHGRTRLADGDHRRVHALGRGSGARATGFEQVFFSGLGGAGDGVVLILTSLGAGLLTVHRTPATTRVRSLRLLPAVFVALAAFTWINGYRASLLASRGLGAAGRHRPRSLPACGSRSSGSS